MMYSVSSVITRVMRLATADSLTHDDSRPPWSKGSGSTPRFFGDRTHRLSCTPWVRTHYECDDHRVTQDSLRPHSGLTRTRKNFHPQGNQWSRMCGHARGHTFPFAFLEHKYNLSLWPTNQNAGEKRTPGGVPDCKKPRN